jgi:glycosyl transferase family 25
MQNIPQIPCFYINLAQSSLRRTFMEDQFAALGLTADRISAVDGNKLSADALPPIQIPDRPEGQLGLTEIGCFLSHRTAWQRILESGQAFGAVFEDDILADEALAALLRKTDWIPANVDCIKLDASPAPDFQKPAEAIPDKGFPLNHRFRDRRGTAGYILSREGAALLLERSETLSHAVDVQMFRTIDPTFLDLAFRQLVPAVCIQQDQYKALRFLPQGAELSTIDNRSEAPRMKFGLRKIVRELYRPLRTPWKRVKSLPPAPYYFLRHGARWTIVRFIKHTR